MPPARLGKINYGKHICCKMSVKYKFRCWLCIIFHIKLKFWLTCCKYLVNWDGRGKINFNQATYESYWITWVKNVTGCIYYTIIWNVILSLLRSQNSWKYISNKIPFNWRKYKLPKTGFLQHQFENAPAPSILNWVSNNIFFMDPDRR